MLRVKRAKNGWVNRTWSICRQFYAFGFISEKIAFSRSLSSGAEIHLLGTLEYGFRKQKNNLLSVTKNRGRSKAIKYPFTCYIFKKSLI